MSKGVELTDLTAFVSFGEVTEIDPELENNVPKSPKISRQLSRIGGLIPYSHNKGDLLTQSTTASGGLDPIFTGLEKQPRKNLQMTEKEKEELMHTKTFLRVQQDIKNRQKRLKQNSEKEKKDRKVDEERNEQQFYIDKARQIGCAQGVDDLKGKLLQQRTLGKKNGEADILMNLFILARQAEHEMKNGDPIIALAYLERGIDIRPEHTELLVLKCRCLVEMSRFKEALIDADLILRNNSRALNPNKNFNMTINQQYAVAYHVKGDALYNLGNFEYALVNYHRANKYTLKKGKAKLFKQISRTERAILNVVGPIGEQYFNELENYLNDKKFKVLKKKAWKGFRHHEEKEESELTSKQNKASDKKFLGELACDKEYLEEMLEKISGHTHANKLDFHDEITSKAEEALNYLKERKEFWAQQQPERPEFPEEITSGQSKSAWNLAAKKTSMKKMKLK